MSMHAGGLDPSMGGAHGPLTESNHKYMKWAEGQLENRKGERRFH